MTTAHLLHSSTYLIFEFQVHSFCIHFFPVLLFSGYSARNQAPTTAYLYLYTWSLVSLEEEFFYFALYSLNFHSRALLSIFLAKNTKISMERRKNMNKKKKKDVLLLVGQRNSQYTSSRSCVRPMCVCSYSQG